MNIIYTFPELPIRNAGKAAKTKKAKIPSLCGSGKKIYPDFVVGGVRWLHDKAGWRLRDIVGLVGASQGQISYWIDGSNRPHVKIVAPERAFWEWLQNRKV
jgi:hypothetical protein